MQVKSIIFFPRSHLAAYFIFADTQKTKKKKTNSNEFILSTRKCDTSYEFVFFFRQLKFCLHELPSAHPKSNEIFFLILF